MVEEIKQPSLIQVRSPERILGLCNKFADIVAHLNDLELMIKGTTPLTKSKVGYDTGRAIAALKDILETFEIGIPGF